MSQRQTIAHHALAALALGNMFQELEVSASIWDERVWRSIHTLPSVLAFEVEHGAVAQREVYNQRLMAKARRSKTPVVGEHAGLCDLFAPVVFERAVVAYIVVGPFASSRPSSASILDRWRWLTKRQGHPADPEFLQFLEATMATLVLNPGELQSLRRAVAVLCESIVGRGGGLSTRYDAMRRELAKVRSVERMWEAARSLVEPSTTRSWSSSYRQPWTLGIDRLPETALVGLAVTHDVSIDPVEELLRRDAFQRASSKLARSVGNLVAGRVGSQGVVLLSAASGTKSRKRERWAELANKLASLGRELGFGLHMGLGSAPEATLTENYQSALTSAESALWDGVRLVQDAPRSRAKTSLLELERKLRQILGRGPEALQAELTRYLDAVARYYGYRLDRVQTYLAQALERLGFEFLEGGAIDEAGFLELRRVIAETERAPTISELFVAYQRAISDLSATLQQPRALQRERGLRRALAYIRQHYAEPLTLAQVSRVAGFAPNYFSGLFKRREKTTFEHYVRELRVERAKILLAQHEIEVQQVAHLSGFRERHYFNRVFRKVVGATPLEYRSQLPGAKVRKPARVTQRA